MNRYIFIALTVLVLAFPVFFGGNVNWAWDAMAFLTGLVLLVWAYFFFQKKTRLRYYSRVKWLVIPFGIVLFWILFQAFVPVPDAWISPIRLEAEAAIGASLPHVISLDPGRSLTGLVRLVTYAMIFFLVLQTATRQENARQGLKAFAIASVGFAIYGLFIHVTGANTILGLEKIYYQDNLTATFVNRNSYATFAGFGVLAITAVCLQNWLSLTARIAGGGRNTVLLTAVEFFSKYWWLVLAWAVVISALLLTGSRAGIISSLLATGFFVTIYFLKRRVSVLKGLFILATLGIFLGLFFVFSGEEISTRLASILGNEGLHDARLFYYAQALTVITDYPWTGTGYDTYPYVFYLYRGMEFEMNLRAIHAHNTYLENALELGIPVALAFLFVFVKLFWLCYKGIRRRQSGFVLPAFGVSLTILIALHSLLDFSMEMPGIAATYAFLIALAITQCWPSQVWAEKRK